jgi:CRP-like cAMP-binding protein
MIRFSDGAPIIRAGTPGDALYVVVDGKVSVQRGGLPSVALGIGSFFGEMALFDDSPRSASVVADDRWCASSSPRFLRCCAPSSIAPAYSGS